MYAIYTRKTAAQTRTLLDVVNTEVQAKARVAYLRRNEYAGRSTRFFYVAR